MADTATKNAPKVLKDQTPAEKPAEAPKAPTPENDKEDKRVQVHFIGTNESGKPQAFAAPPKGILGIKVQHNPGDDLPAESFTLKREDLEAFPDLKDQLAFFGASVLLRNCINTLKDETAAREKLVQRFTGFKNGVYRTIGEGGEVTPLVIRALEKALTDAGKDAKEVTAKVEKYQKQWNEADKAGKTKLREFLKQNKQVREAMVAIQNKPKDESKEVGLGDL